LNLVAQQDKKPAKPNIIFILVDDMGWKDLGVMEALSMNHPT